MVGAYALGIYPRSPELVEATRRNDKKLASMFQEEKNKIIREEQKAGLSFISDPLIDWSDMFRPFSNIKGITLGALNRFFETNTFYRKLVINDRLDNYGNIVKSHLFLSIRRKIALSMPDPYTFADLNENNYYNDEEYVMAIADMLNKEAQTLAKAGVSLIQLNAPSIAYNANKLNFSLIKDAIERVKRNVKSKIYLHLYFGDVAKIFERLIEINIDGISVDLISTKLEDISGYKIDKGIALGVVDAMNTKMEDPRATAKRLTTALNSMKPKEAYICTSCDLEFLPYEFAMKKLPLLAKIAKSVKYNE